MSAPGILVIAARERLAALAAQVAQLGHRPSRAACAWEVDRALSSREIDAVLLSTEGSTQCEERDLREAARAASAWPVVALHEDERASFRVAEWLRAAPDVVWAGTLEHLDLLATERPESPRIDRWVGLSDAASALRTSVAAAARAGGPVVVSGEAGSGKFLAARELARRRGASLTHVDAAAVSVRRLEALARIPPARSVLLLDHLELLPAWSARALGAVLPRTIARLAQRGSVLAATITTSPDGLTTSVPPAVLSRLSGVRIEVPPLRERIDDAPLLAREWARRRGLESKEPLRVTCLAGHAWPGNVRELFGAFERVASRLDRADAEAPSGSWRRPLALRLPVKERDALATLVRATAASFGSLELAAYKLGCPVDHVRILCDNGRMQRRRSDSA